MVTFVCMRWPWLILPALLEITGLIFLLAMKRASRKCKLSLWKASLWPLLFRGLHLDVPVRANNVRHMQQMAETMNARLRLDDDGRLVLAR